MLESLKAGRKSRNPESVFEKGALSHAHELKGALVSVDLSPSIGLLPPFVSSTRILLVIIKPRLTNAAFSTRLPLADAANKHCCDSRGVKPDIRHPPRLTCLSPFFFIARRLTPPTRPPLLIRSLSLSLAGWTVPGGSAPSVRPFHDHRPRRSAGIALCTRRELCGSNMAAALRLLPFGGAHASGTAGEARR